MTRILVLHLIGWYPIQEYPYIQSFCAYESLIRTKIQTICTQFVSVRTWPAGRFATYGEPVCAKNVNRWWYNSIVSATYESLVIKVTC